MVCAKEHLMQERRGTAGTVPAPPRPVRNLCLDSIELPVLFRSGSRGVVDGIVQEDSW